MLGRNSNIIIWKTIRSRWYEKNGTSIEQTLVSSKNETIWRAKRKQQESESDFNFLLLSELRPRLAPVENGFPRRHYRGGGGGPPHTLPLPGTHRGWLIAIDKHIKDSAGSFLKHAGNLGRWRCKISIQAASSALWENSKNKNAPRHIALVGVPRGSKINPRLA